MAARLCLFIFSVGGDLIPLSEGWPLHRRDGGDRKRPPDSKEGWRCEENEDKSMMGKGGRAAGSSHRHALLSKQLSSQGGVTAGHGGITLLANKRELLARKAARGSPATRRL